MKFCPACGGAVALRRPEGDALERFVCDACDTIHYVNPKVVVGAVCRLGDKLLLCRRAIEPRAGYWTIPAGYMELGETTEEGARREVWEEARARIALEGLLAVYSVARISQVQVFYRARLVSPSVAAGPESQEVAFFGWDTIPWDHLAFPTVDWALRRAEELRQVAGDFPAVGNPAAGMRIGIDTTARAAKGRA